MKKVLSFIVKHKKSIIVLCCVFIIGVSVYSDFMLNASKKDVSAGNYMYNSGVSEESTKILGEAKLVDSIGTAAENETLAESDSYFTSAQLNRERSRDEALETLQVVIDSSETMPDVKDEALNRMITIASEIETEALVEEMIKAKGFEDCLAVMTGDNINVIVKTPGLLTAEVAQITEIVMQETGLSPENITIVEKN
ncbi:MAG: SpoIIIAH-like family protein [Eubacteriales bacterium]